ncbi:MAG: sugar ABC transporter substrate-binding protein [Spirochaetaceae bacterium]|jgi:ribose transport system substrate-binding protein|nr:sugar ABC transporter substrate-binding protein [Spirochaetaceae bacterium]
MKKLRLFMCMCAALIALSFITGCNRGGKKGDKIVVGAVLKTLSSPYWQTVAAGLRAQAEADNVELILLGPPTEDAVEQQLNMVQDLLTQGVSVLVFSPSQPDASVKVLLDAKSKKIPVVLVDTKMQDGFEDYATFIGTTNLTAGEDAAKAILAKSIPPASNVVIIDGAPGNPSTSDRSNGAEEIFKNAGMNVIRQPAYSDRARALDVMDNVLQSTPDVAAVFAANDDMGMGAYRSLQQKNKTETWVIGVDAIEDALNIIIAGGKYISLAQRSYGMGTLSIEAAVKLSKGEPVDKRIDSGTDMIDSPEKAQKQKEFLASILK